MDTEQSRDSVRQRGKKDMREKEKILDDRGRERNRYREQIEKERVREREDCEI